MRKPRSAVSGGGKTHGEAYQLVHGTADHMLGHDDGTGDGEDGTMLALASISGGGHGA